MQALALSLSLRPGPEIVESALDGNSYAIEVVEAWRFNPQRLRLTVRELAPTSPLWLQEDCYANL